MTLFQQARCPYLPIFLVPIFLEKVMLQMVKANAILAKITIKQVVLTDQKLVKRGYRPRQMWRRR
jgi:hypothetical protein